VKEQMRKWLTGYRDLQLPAMRIVALTLSTCDESRYFADNEPRKFAGQKSDFF
jgi:hypothetical protein